MCFTKKASYKRKMQIFNWITKLYGSEKDGNKRAIGIGVWFLVMGVAMLLLSLLVDTDAFSKGAMIYGTSVFGASAYFSFCSYFFSKERRKDRFKKTKYAFFISSVLIVGIVFSPVFLVVALSKKIKFESFVAHTDKYVIATCIPFLIATVVGLKLFVGLYDAKWVNSATISMLAAFALWLLLSFGILKLYKLLSKNFDQKDYLSIKKDLYVLLFAMITVVTIVANCIKFDGIYKELVDGITKTFAIYIALDRLYGRWKGYNSDYEKVREKIEAEKK